MAKHRWITGPTGESRECTRCGMRQLSERTKEEVYDNDINPLMSQILDICKQHRIAMVSSFSLGKEEDGSDFLCSSMLMSKGFDPPEVFWDLRKRLLRS